MYLFGVIPAWACVVSNALFTSILHELEHDLIHNLYFKRQPALQNLMMLVAWVFRGNIINPWFRRTLHLLHHKVSGHASDLEEQLIGNGLKYGFARFIAIMDGFLSTCLRGSQLARIPAYQASQLALATIPCMLIFVFLWYSWLGFHLLNCAMAFVGTDYQWPQWVMSAIPILDAIAVIYLVPNVIRQSCFNFVSSTMHYFGDVEGIIDQTQVLNSWCFVPFQLFCFNFDSTHGIHHFVVSQPFHIRQMVVGYAHLAMRKYGVRFNDLGTFR